MTSTSTHSTATGSTTPSRIAPSTSDLLCDALMKRIALLVYLKGVLSGKHLYASAVLFTPRDLAEIYDTERMRRRSYRHLALGLALSPLVEQTAMPLADFMRSFLNALADVEALPENAGGSSGAAGSSGGAGGSSGSSIAGSEKRSVRNLFSSSKSKGQKKGGTFSDLHPPEYGMMGGAGGGDAAMAGGNLPFPLDFLRTFYTLADILIEVYSKLLAYLGATPATPTDDAAPTGTGAESSSGHATTPASGPLSSQVVDAINKADGKVKKLLSQVTKELDAAARHVVKEELAQLEASLTTAAGGGGAPLSRPMSAPYDKQGDHMMAPISPITGLPGPPAFDGTASGPG